MANIVFQGPAALTLDGKGRIAMPARHRELLAAMGVNQLTITKHPEGSLMIFPRPAWEDFRERVAALPMDGERLEARLPRQRDGRRDRCVVARADRARTARRRPGLVRDVMLLGMGSHFELWDAQRHAEHEAAVMQSPMPDSLKTLASDPQPPRHRIAAHHRSCCTKRSMPS